ncbi:MAG: GPR endopeptidase, partial [Oscillospiraceae bacterium]|nr:GPR endopeptidase [Oscillospiraceae bacterium]
MRSIRTDLALEARELYEQSCGKVTRLKGVEAYDKTEDGIRISTVKILNEEGAEALGKPAGSYITLFVPRGGVYGEELKRCAKALRMVINGMYNFKE